MILKNAIKMALLFPIDVSSVSIYVHVFVSVLCVYVYIYIYMCPCMYTHTSPGVYVYIYGYPGCLQQLRECTERRKLILEAVSGVSF